jgi:hypothetical protein
VYALASYSAQFDETLLRVTEAAGHVDAIIVVAPDPAEMQRFTLEQEAALIKAGAVISHHVWVDDLVGFRNACFEAAREQKADWLLLGAPDELFSAKLLADLKAKIVPSLEKNGMGAAGVMCLEDFADLEWPTDLLALDSLARITTGYNRETTWRFKLVKLTPETAYASGGVAVKDGTKTGNLPYQYSYTHRKSALRLWRDAAMRVYLSGGGRDVREQNAMWKELLAVCQGLNIGNWPLLEQYVTTFHVNTTHAFGEPLAEGEERWPTFNPLAEWCKKALRWKATGYGLDCRRLAEWVVFYHRDLLEDRAVAEGLLMPPKPTKEDEAEDYITDGYVDVLKRLPDKDGLEGYMKLILSGRLPREQLAAVLRQSAEGKKAVAPEAENIRVDLPITAVLHLTDDWLSKTLQNSKTWRERWQPPLDVGRFVESQLGKPFMDRFYELKAKDSLTLNSFLDALYATVAEKAKPAQKQEDEQVAAQAAKDALEAKAA